MINILHIIESLSNYGGTPRKLLTLTQYHDNTEGTQIFFCYLPSDLQEKFETNDAVVEVLSGTSLIAITRNALSLVRKHKIDLICTHFTRPLIAGYLTAIASGLPIIHCEHSSANYRRGVGRFMSKFILPNVQSILCNSYYTKDSVSEAFALPSEKLEVLHNPVYERKSKLSRIQLRSEFGLDEDEVVIGHIGGMIPQRDHVTLIKAFSEIRNFYNKTRLFIIGDGPKRTELESLVNKLGLEGKVVFVGYTDRVGDYLKLMDIYVNPTLDEGFGIAVVEAMLSGLPVVITNAGAHPELIQDGISGFLYPAGNESSLHSIIVRLVGNDIIREIVGNAARSRAESLFRPERYAKAFLAHAKEIVYKHKSSASTHPRKGWRWKIPF